MITSVIGRKFLKAYNEKFSTQYDAKSFFIEKLYPLVYESNKYAQWITNSPFVQGLESSSSGEFGVSEVLKDKKGNTLKFSTQKDLDTFVSNLMKERNDILEIKGKRLNQIKILKKLDGKSLLKIKETFLNKVENSSADNSIAIGYPSLDENATTSGQVSNVDIIATKDDIYSSWIGGCLGLCVGEYSILFNNSRILLDTYDGWEFYRSSLNKNRNLEGHKINVWNTQWLAHKYDKRGYIDNIPMANFNPFITEKGSMNVVTLSWTKLLIRISMTFTNLQIMGYVYSYRKVNKTIGFIPFILNQIRTPVELYQQIFGQGGTSGEELWGTAYSFVTACQNGAIGIRAMEPQGLQPYVSKGILPKYNMNKIINFNVYQIWIMAMLNNQELWDKSQEFAKEMQLYASNEGRGKTSKLNKVKLIMESTNKINFIRSLESVVSDIDNSNKVEEIASIVNSMPSDNIPYFLALIRFHFASINNINNKK